MCSTEELELEEINALDAHIGSVEEEEEEHSSSSAMLADALSDATPAHLPPPLHRHLPCTHFLHHLLLHHTLLDVEAAHQLSHSSLTVPKKVLAPSDFVADLVAIKADGNSAFTFFVSIRPRSSRTE